MFQLRLDLDPNIRAETELKDAAWYYPDTKEKANHIKNYVAFCESPVAGLSCDACINTRTTDKTMVDVSTE